MRRFMKLMAGLAGLAGAAIVGGAIAQGVTVPAQLQIFVDAFKKGPPQYGNSIYNYFNLATQAAGDDEDKQKTLVSAARNWLFSRSESQLKSLVQTYKPQLRQLFETLYLSKGLQAVMTKSFGANTQTLYHAWYDCMAKMPNSDYGDSGPNNVLGNVYSAADSGKLAGPNGECQTQLTALSTYYGVKQLSFDELTVVAFFSRREQAHGDNSTYTSADTVRVLVRDIFD